MRRCGVTTRALLLPLYLDNAAQWSVSVRGYTSPYNEDFVPRGATTSRIHSSSVPSERVRVLQEYALAPLFGTRRAAFILGSTASPKRLIAVKAALRQCLAEMIEVPEAHIVLGSIQMLPNMMLQRSDPLRPRLDPKTAALVATSLIPVYLDAAIYDDAAEVDAIAEMLTEILRHHPEDAKPLVSLGITHVETEPEDVSGIVVGSIGGRVVDEDAALEAADRWDARVAALEKLSAQEAHQEQ